MTICAFLDTEIIIASKYSVFLGIIIPSAGHESRRGGAQAHPGRQQTKKTNTTKKD